MDPAHPVQNSTERWRGAQAACPGALRRTSLALVAWRKASGSIRSRYTDREAGTCGHNRLSSAIIRGIWLDISPGNLRISRPSEGGRIMRMSAAHGSNRWHLRWRGRAWGISHRIVKKLFLTACAKGAKRLPLRAAAAGRSPRAVACATRPEWREAAAVFSIAPAIVIRRIEVPPTPGGPSAFPQPAGCRASSVSGIAKRPLRRHCLARVRRTDLHPVVDLRQAAGLNTRCGPFQNAYPALSSARFLARRVARSSCWR